ncbi:MAG: RES family NAD+ phosphorylase [Ekhidna sp.]|nr:RES family NAD+ phosphorylase [Ekhidna sp.]
MLVYRLSKEKCKEDLSGDGASYGVNHRWNTKGTNLLYTSSSRALACLEVAVHIPLGLLPKSGDYHMMSIDIPDNIKIFEPPLNLLPTAWNSRPVRPESQDFGDQFVAKCKFAILKVPSIVVAGDYNYLINPKHYDFKEIKPTLTEPFPFDPRLLGLK